MKAAQLKGLTTDQLMENYRELSARHGHAIEAGHHKAANRDFDKMGLLQDPWVSLPGRRSPRRETVERARSGSTGGAPKETSST